MGLGGIKYQVTAEEKENAARVIYKLLNFDTEARQSAVTLSRILDRELPGVRKMYAGLLSGTEPENAKIADTKLPRLIVDFLQLDLLEPSDLRELLLRKLHEVESENEIFIKSRGETPPYSNSLFGKEKYAVEELLAKRWIPGSREALKFVRSFGFPEIFAGIKSAPPPPPAEDIEGPIILPELRDFQENIKSQIAVLLKENSGRKNRGIIRLPTGAGKTRIVAEALLDYWKSRPHEIKYLLWISQTEELCEQAFQSFRQLWTSKGESGQRLRLFRMWGGRRMLPNLDEEGIIIAGIDKLYHGIKQNDNVSDFQTGLESLSRHIGAVIVDEAHQSITRMYVDVFKELGIKFPSPDERQIPLIGLTATPYRGYSGGQTKHLLKQYNSNVLYPKGRGFENPMWLKWRSLKDELTRQRILSKPIHEVIPTRLNFHVNFNDIISTESPENRFKLRPNLLDDIASAFERNKIVLDKLLELAKEKKSILFFAPSVDNANIMSSLLNDKEVTTAVVTGQTSWGVRQMYVRKFKDQEIRILCNYGVLTTGFDAPLIDAIMIARPTESPNLYEQMIGRGLRGPEFGGTEECLIMDLLDNIYIHKLSQTIEFTDGSINYWDSMNVTDDLDIPA